MNNLIVQLALLQVALPVVVIVVNGLIPTATTVGFALRTAAVLMVILYAAIAGIWLFPPWWSPYVLLVLHLLLSFRQYRAFRTSHHVNTAVRFAEIAMAAAALAGGTTLVIPAMQGRITPDIAIDLVMPLGPGHYLVISGGASPVINAHFDTLTRESAAPFRGQSYAIDIIGINSIGSRASGISPTDPAQYIIYGRDVLAPCSGLVLATVGGVSDNRVPIMNRETMTGNSIILDCNGLAVVLAHFKPNSITVSKGDRVTVGQKIAQVGNSGNSGEPHLHVHVQSIAPGDTPISGEPFWFTINGVFPTRNARIGVDN